MIILVFSAALFLSHEGLLNPPTRNVIAYTLAGSYAFFGVRIATLLYSLWRGRSEWRRRATDQTIAQDEEWAEPLRACSEGLLIYSKAWIKRLSDRNERASHTLMKDLGIVPAIALLYGAYTAWHSFHMDANEWHLDGTLLQPLTAMSNTLFWVSLLTVVSGLLASRITVMRYAYRMELIDIAIERKLLSAVAASPAA